MFRLRPFSTRAVGITGNIKSQIDQIWNAFWSGGISNPLEVIEQITYLLFLRRLDDLHTLEENKSARLKRPMERRVFPAGNDSRRGRSYERPALVALQALRAGEMYTVVGEHVFPFLRTLGGDGSTYAQHMKDARFTIPTPALLAKVVDLLDAVPMEDRDTKGDVYEYMLGKIASAGQNGQFRTPRHIIRLMVELTAPQPDRRHLRPGLRHRRLPRRRRRGPARAPPEVSCTTRSCASTSITTCSTASTSTTPCCASAA
jgi:type I restriction enzyme M protein